MTFEGKALRGRKVRALLTDRSGHRHACTCHSEAKPKNPAYGLVRGIIRSA